MKIVDLLHKNGIDLNFSPSSKAEAIDKLVDLMDSTGNLINKNEYKEAILAREALSTTGIGEGIAIPHGKTKAVKRASLAAAVSKKGVDYDSLDGSPANLFFMIAAPEGKNEIHLEVLARLSTILMDEEFRNSLINAKDKNEFLKLIDDKENEKFPEEGKKEATTNSGAKYRVLAVTACPTGIAHTYMAAESLNNKAEEMGITIKVETNGSGGAKNVLTKEEIENCDAIIVAADKKIDMARFEGKKVIQTKVADGIHKSEELINRAINGDAPIYHHDGSIDSEDAGEEENVGRKIYKHLMNGVSHMLPFVIGGGILIALAFLFDNYEINPSSFGSNTPVAAFFMRAGGAAFGFMLPVLAGYIAMSIGDRPALAVGFVGGFLANQGGSGFLGALIAGFVAGYLVLGLKKLFSNLPNALEGIKPVLLYPLFGILLIAVIIVFAINPPVAAINNGFNNFLTSMGSSSRILVGIIVAGMMAVDMGGPINKASYVFGVASLQSGNFEIMAAVMAGGMVPPLAIAIATTLFRNKFTKKDREAGLTNFIMGLSFITEGAIPFAAADPLRVISSSVVGASIAGALSIIFNCTLRAPHGGIFVVPVIGNPLGYIVSVVVGSIVGAIMLGLLKKPLEQKK
jgi:PTS system fructose-specific IIC component